MKVMVNKSCLIVRVYGVSFNPWMLFLGSYFWSLFQRLDKWRDPTVKLSSLDRATANQVRASIWRKKSYIIVSIAAYLYQDFIPKAIFLILKKCPKIWLLEYVYIWYTERWVFKRVQLVLLKIFYKQMHAYWNILKACLRHAVFNRNGTKLKCKIVCKMLFNDSFWALYWDCVRPAVTPRLSKESSSPFISGGGECYKYYWTGCITVWTFVIYCNITLN